MIMQTPSNLPKYLQKFIQNVYIQLSFYLI